MEYSVGVPVIQLSSIYKKFSGTERDIKKESSLSMQLLPSQSLPKLSFLLSCAEQLSFREDTHTNKIFYQRLL